MSVFVYCQRPSDSARELCQELPATRLRRFDGVDFWHKGKRVRIKEGDSIICWGDDFPSEFEGVRILNGADIGNKYKAAEKLSKGGVATISFRKEAPRGAAGLTPEQLITAGWLPRRNFHVGGNDLLNPGRADFWVVKEPIAQEIRIHCFLGKSIRAGIKRLREGYYLEGQAKPTPDAKLASSWIRSFDGGWRIVYDNFQTEPSQRALARNALKALGLQFGAVDIGIRNDGSLLVLEVNRAPGLEGGSIVSYVNHIKKWLEGKDEEVKDGSNAKRDASNGAANRDQAEARINRAPNVPQPQPRQEVPAAGDQPGFLQRIIRGEGTPQDWDDYRRHLRALEERLRLQRR